jgi:hypothetical protein
MSTGLEITEAERNGDYEAYPAYLPVGTRVWCEVEWAPGKWKQGAVSHHKWNSYGIPQWIFIELDDGTQTEYDYRYLDVEDPRNSLVKKVK